MYINLFFGRSLGLYPLRNRSICSYICVQVCIYILLISLKIDLKLAFTSKNHNEATICHLFRDVTIHIIAVSKTFILRTRMLLWFLVKRWLRKTETVRSES